MICFWKQKFAESTKTTVFHGELCVSVYFSSKYKNVKYSSDFWNYQNQWKTMTTTSSECSEWSLTDTWILTTIKLDRFSYWVNSLKIVSSHEFKNSPLAFLLHYIQWIFHLHADCNFFWACFFFKSIIFYKIRIFQHKPIYLK